MPNQHHQPSAAGTTTTTNQKIAAFFKSLKSSTNQQQSVKPEVANDEVPAKKPASVATPSNRLEIAYKVNLGSLQRLDMYICDIIARALHVELFEFVPAESGSVVVDEAFSTPEPAAINQPSASNTWQKLNISGPLFMTRRRRKPYFGIIILNKLGLDNFVGQLGGDGDGCVLEYKLDEKSAFISWKAASSTKGCKIYGIWFSPSGYLAQQHPEEVPQSTSALSTPSDGQPWFSDFRKVSSVFSSARTQLMASSVRASEAVQHSQHKQNRSPLEQQLLSILKVQQF